MVSIFTGYRLSNSRALEAYRAMAYAEQLGNRTEVSGSGLFDDPFDRIIHRTDAPK